MITEVKKIENLEKQVEDLKAEILSMKYQDDLLLEKIEGRMAIAEHTNVFLDIVFILLSVVLWVVTMEGWKNQRELSLDKKRLMEDYNKEAEEIKGYKVKLKEDIQSFQSQYSLMSSDMMSNIASHKDRIDKGYDEMKKEHEAMMREIKGTSEYYLELVAISHEPDLQERVFEYERIIKNADKYDLSSDERARVYYYISITLFEIAKQGQVSQKAKSDSIKKASRYIQKAIDFGGKRGMFFYEKGKIELELYKQRLILTKNFDDFVSQIHEIEEYFEIATKTIDIEFYMFEEIVIAFRDLVESVSPKESERRIVYDMIISLCERARSFDVKEYAENLQEIRDDIDKKLNLQNTKLDID